MWCPPDSSKSKCSGPSIASGCSAGLSDAETAIKRKELTELLAMTDLAPVDGTVIDRAKSSFAVNLRAIDAIHVATAELLAAAADGEPLEFWTHDEPSGHGGHFAWAERPRRRCGCSRLMSPGRPAPAVTPTCRADLPRPTRRASCWSTTPPGRRRWRAVAARRVRTKRPIRAARTRTGCSRCSGAAPGSIAGSWPWSRPVRSLPRCTGGRRPRS